MALDVCFINTLPVLSGLSWERHAPAWLLGPGWSPAFPGGGTGAGLTKWTSSRAFRKYVTSYFDLCSAAMVAVRRACLCYMAKLTYHELTKRCTSTGHHPWAHVHRDSSGWGAWG